MRPKSEKERERRIDVKGKGIAVEQRKTAAPPSIAVVLFRVIEPAKYAFAAIWRMYAERSFS
jgi:hypothetical protein